MPKMDTPPAVEPEGVKAIASKQGRKFKLPERKVKHKDFEVRLCWSGKGATHPPLDLEQVKEILHLETETEYIARMLKEDEKLRESVVTFPKYLQVMTTPTKEKFVCWNNVNNRRFREGDCLRLAYEFLDGRWAGPHNFPGETVNGEPVRITRLAYVFDGQHRLISYYFACLLREANPRYQEKWKDGIPFETVLMLGVSDAKQVYDTVDNTIPRSFADNTYTSDSFRDLSEDQRWECSKNYAAAVDALWKRTGADGMGTGASYRSFATLDDFAKQHKTIEKCVRWIFDCNYGDRNGMISDLAPAGQCAATMYLMGCGESDGDVYRQGNKQGNRREKELTWSRLDKTKEFWEAATNVDNPLRQVLYTAVEDKVDERTGAIITVKATERLAILALAWHIWYESGKVLPTDLDLGPFMKPDSAGRIQLVDPPTFGNLDLGPGAEVENKEEIEAAARKEREDKARAAAKVIEDQRAVKTNGETPDPAAVEEFAGQELERQRKKGKGKKPAAPATPGKPEWEQLEDVRKEHPGKVLLFKGSATVYLYNGDVDRVIQAHGQRPIRDVSNNGLRVASWPLDHCLEIVAALKDKGMKVAVASKDARGGTRVEDR